ncbi:hypothetical protein N7532_003296 [Penicillium argentinense]|uniref:Rhodopsin domain-containing protein n=1 Tax=Penicillium argentinense TaxID=1131581 RepID=A0A9W9KF31_9EURO|nr:uncharacterized protein N7532_003296 [Penicillium argentinense]KAJ5102767.1 hypothetical protein N7532_003296 [Penicillium argentinense]
MWNFEVSNRFAVTRYGYGRHFALIEADTETIDFLAAVSYLISLASIKVSICLLYLKVFSITKLRWLYYLVIVIALNWSSVEVCVAILIACIPSFRIVAARTCPILQKTFGLRSSHESSQQIETLQTSPLDQTYSTSPTSVKPSGPRDCFPLPSPLAEEGIDPFTSMTGGLVPEIPEQVVSTSRGAEQYLRTIV